MWIEFAFCSLVFSFFLFYPISYSISEYMWQKTRYIAFHNDNIRRKAGYVKKWYGWVSPENQARKRGF